MFSSLRRTRLVRILTALACLLLLYSACAKTSDHSLPSTALGIPAGGASYGDWSVEDLERASDVVVVARVSAIGAARLNLANPARALENRELYDATTPVTPITLTIESAVGARSVNRFKDSAAYRPGAAVVVNIQHGRFDFNTTLADRERLGLMAYDDEVGGTSRGLKTGTVRLTKAFDSGVLLDRGDRVVAYLTYRDLPNADDPGTERPVPQFAIGALSVFKLNIGGAVAVPASLRGSEVLKTIDGVNASGERVAKLGGESHLN